MTDPANTEDLLTSPLQYLMASGQVLKNMKAGVIVLDGDGQVIDSNDQAVEIIGAPREMLGSISAFRRGWDTVHEDGSAMPLHESPAIRTLETGESCTDLVIGSQDAHHARRWVSVSTFPVSLEDGAKGVLATFVDVTSQFKIRHMLELLTAVNRVVMLAQDEQSCLEQLCSTLVDRGHYSLAWLGALSDGDDGRLEILYSAGASEFLNESLDSWSGSDGSDRGPIREALKTRTTQVIDDLKEEGWSSSWRGQAQHFGLGSSATLIIAVGGRTAVLTICDRNLFMFDEVIVNGLEEIAKQVEFGLTHVGALQGTKAALDEMTAAMDALRITESALVESEQRFRLAFEGNMAPMLFLNLDDEVTAANDAFCSMIGRTREEILGYHWPPYTHPEDVGISEEANRRLVAGEADQVHYVKRYLHKDGRTIVVEMSKYAARDHNGTMQYSVTSARDVTEERELTAQLKHQALHDPLTSLANRVLFEDRLSQAYARTARQGGYGAVLLLDLDDFKGVNDAHGHLVGDELLAGIARRFELVTRSSDTLSRFGGDEFLYLAEGLSSPEEAEEVAKRLLGVLAEPFMFSGMSFEQFASVGIAVWDASSTDVKEIIQNADMALYEAKRRGKGHSVVFTPTIHQQAVGRFALTQELRQALRSGQLAMHYQPIIHLATSEVVGFEALMRWRHPDRGWVPPNMFIPLAEQSDLILELGAFALHEAVSAAASWDATKASPSAPYVTVNISANQFNDPGLISMVEGALHASGLSAKRLIVEITESVLLFDIAETISVMERLGHLGVGIALDDFGTGYSSLSYLVRLNPKIIKIDQYFISPMIEGDQSEKLLETIVSLGSKLDMTMCAEGIETREQLEQLRELGCDLGQGYLFSPAVPASDVPEMIARGARAWNEVTKRN